MTAPVENIELDGPLYQWLVGLGLDEIWDKAAQLETRRCDYYRSLLLKVYIAERRRAERSARFQLSRGR